MSANYRMLKKHESDLISVLVLDYWKSTDESNILLGLLLIKISETLPTSTLVTIL